MILRVVHAVRLRMGPLACMEMRNTYCKKPEKGLKDVADEDVREEINEGSEKAKKHAKKIAKVNKKLEQSGGDTGHPLERVYPSGDVHKTDDNSLEKMQKKVDHVKRKTKEVENVKGIVE
ncbi:unnamed protein product [Cylicocyclus nassatus]|uniref:Uncharacterized protein n=1 Tax=Cylicocyclus nassatus TaxID=53992 RepID=A0AA36HBV0_CYLNA|nr:unnamed protein product [Cylicocyclus nassatus]